MDAKQHSTLAEAIAREVGHISRGCRSNRSHNPNAHERAIEDALANLEEEIEGALEAAYDAEEVGDELRREKQRLEEQYEALERDRDLHQGKADSYQREYRALQEQLEAITHERDYYSQFSDRGDWLIYRHEWLAVIDTLREVEDGLRIHARGPELIGLRHLIVKALEPYPEPEPETQADRDRRAGSFPASTPEERFADADLEFNRANEWTPDPANEPLVTDENLAAGKGCWYYETVWACVLCSHADIYRERRWSRKPRDPRERGEFHETACSEHFV